MATTIDQQAPSRAPSGDQRVVLRGIDWETYRRLAESIGDQQVRIAYDRGVLELMSPGPAHEAYKRLLGRLIEAVSEELEIPCKSLSATLWDRPEAERGLEADECYYLTAGKVAAAVGLGNNA